MMQTIRADAAEAGTALEKHLIQQLRSNRDVLWLVSGGSNISTAVTIMTHIPAELTRKLTIMLTDERYGNIDHPDSNMLQLHHAGFDPKHGAFIPVLTGGTFEDTARLFTETVRIQYNAHKIIIGQLGIGADGHTAGILPRSSAAAEQVALAIGYYATDFARITLTFPALRRLTTAYILAYGASKRDALLRLHDEQVAIESQPAQVFKAIPQAYVYNDQIG